MDNSKCTCFVTVSKDGTFFTVKSKIFLGGFSFNGGYFTSVFFFHIGVDEISREDGGSSNETFVGKDQMFGGNTERGFA